MGRIIFVCFVFMIEIIGCAHQSQFTYPPKESLLPTGSTSYINGTNSTVQPKHSPDRTGPVANTSNTLKRSVYNKGAKNHGVSSDLGNGEYPSETYQDHEPYGKGNSPHQMKLGINTALDQAIDFCNISQSFREKGDIEKALQALDHAYGLILKIDEADGGEAIQQKEDLRFTISKRILEIYASRTLPLLGKHKSIPINLNQRVMDEVRSFTVGAESDFFISAYARSGKYRAFIEKALEEAGLPKELSWLPLIESGFKPSALSPARALGLWQFIPSTGYRYGLSRNKFVDERLDFEKSTLAAISYLKDLHELFGDWETVLAAYNCGEGKVLRTIRTQNINFLDNFWDLYEQLPAETARYVPRFIATLHVVNNLEKYGLKDIGNEPPLTYETVEVSQAVHLRDIASSIGISESTITELNPELRYNILPGFPYNLRIPVGHKDTLIANIGNIPEYSTPKTTFVFHTVNSGETLSSIADQFQTTPDEIMQANDEIDNSGHAIAGQRLKIPLRNDNQNYSSDSTIASSPKKVREHRSSTDTETKSNNTTRQISASEKKSKHHLTHEHAATCSKKIEKNNKQVTIKIPAIPKKAQRHYKVRNGDNPISIANFHKMSVDRFLDLNKLKPTAKLQLGQKLLVE